MPPVNEEVEAILVALGFERSGSSLIWMNRKHFVTLHINTNDTPFDLTTKLLEIGAHRKSEAIKKELGIKE
jgi:hypothetical protein